MQRCMILFIVLGLVACQSAPAVSLPSTNSPVDIASPTATPSPLPTLTLTPSATPTIEELVFPFTIEGLRQHQYQGGKIHIRANLDKHDSFTTYLIDYPSDGLTFTGVMHIPVGAVSFFVIVLNHGFFTR